MKFDIVQRTDIIKKLQDYGIRLVDEDSSFLAIDFIDADYFFEKLEEALNEVSKWNDMKILLLLSVVEILEL